MVFRMKTGQFATKRREHGAAETIRFRQEGLTGPSCENKTPSESA